MALSLLNPPPSSRIALKPPVPPRLGPAFLLSPPRLRPLHLRNPPPLLVRSSSAPSAPPTDDSPAPPSSREEAVAQARACLATALRKPFNNSLPARKARKQQRQPRFRAEIPVVDDDSPGSLARLAFDVFSALGVSRKGSPARLLLVWPSAEHMALAVREFQSWGDSSSALAHAQLGSVAPDALASCDAAVFLAPGRPQVEKLRAAVNALDPRPAVLFNPAWSYEVEEEGFGGAGAAKGFVGSFNVVYSFMGLEVKGLLSRKKGVLLRCVEGGRFGGDSWVLMMEDEEKEPELKVVSRMKRRPTVAEVENIMYNLMAANSPVTKSARFLRELVSNVTGRKEKQ